MKKKISTILVLLLLFSSWTVFGYEDEQIANNYSNFLNSSKDRRISKEAMKHMWHSFWEYIGVYKNDDNNNKYDRNNSSRNDKSSSNIGNKRISDRINSDSNIITSLAVTNNGDKIYTDNNKSESSYKKVFLNSNNQKVYAIKIQNNTNYIYEVYPTKHVVRTINSKINFDNNVYIDDDKIIYSNNKNQLCINNEPILTLKGNNVFAIRNDVVYILNNRAPLIYKINTRTGQINSKKKKDAISFDNGCSYHGNFYVTKDNIIHVLNLNGRSTRTVKTNNIINSICVNRKIYIAQNKMINEID